MEIKNLTQLKKAISAGTCFIIQRHYLKPEYTGQIRKPNKIQTNGFYSVVLGKPEDEVSRANAEKGSWFGYGKAKDWAFEDGLCKYVKNDRAIWEISLVPEDEVMTCAGDIARLYGGEDEGELARLLPCKIL